jgi:RNA polymerase sigma factor (sigma-70 family)
MRPVRISFLEAYDKHKSEVERYFMRRIVSRSLYEEVLQETFLVALEKWNTYDPSRAKPGTWFIAIGIRVAKKYFAQEQKERKRYGRADSRSGWADELADDYQFEAASIERSDAQAARGKIARALAQLSLRRLEVVTMSYWTTLSQKEIAQVLGIKESTVRTTLEEALAQLARNFEYQGPSHD